MLNFVLLAILQGNILIESGASLGTNFVNTGIHVAPSVSVHAFPFPIKNIGIFNTLEWRNHHFGFNPFKVGVKDKVFVIGSVFRFIKPKVQPSFRIGAMRFEEDIEVIFLDEAFANEKIRKNSLFLGTGVYLKIWKKLYLDPEISFAVSGRPPWRISARAGWFF